MGSLWSKTCHKEKVSQNALTLMLLCMKIKIAANWYHVQHLSHFFRLSPEKQ